MNTQTVRTVIIAVSEFILTVLGGVCYC